MAARCRGRVLMSSRITVVSAGHLSTCPRMLKAADTFHAAGYHVRVVSTCQTAWAAAADTELRSRRPWKWDVVSYGRGHAPARWLLTGARVRIAAMAASVLGRSRPFWLSVRAFNRVHDELVSTILREPGDFIYGGGNGALVAVAEASRRSGIPCAVDFEDFHCAEHSGGADASLRDDLAAEMMAAAVGRAAFVTAGSDAIGRACAKRFGATPLTINNVFPLPHPPAMTRSTGPLTLYWFSQTIGPNRGLEDVVRAAGRARIDAELHVRGAASPDYMPTLYRLASEQAPNLRIIEHAPANPDTMVDACRPYDVGLSVEQGHTINNALSLSNKALTYPLAGLAVVLTATAGQWPLARDLGTDAVVYAAGDVDVLADGLARWHADRGVLLRAREAAWEAARRRWHWEHPLEREALLAAVHGAMN